MQYTELITVITQLISDLDSKINQLNNDLTLANEQKRKLSDALNELQSIINNS